MSRAHFVSAYEAHTERLLDKAGDDERALELAIGASSPEEFSAIGEMQHQLLMACGLQPSSALVEVGCGSGRLAVQLAGWLHGPYLGLDVVQTLLDRAAAIATGPHMRYQKVDGLAIPVETDHIDVVCAFSVFTHLRHEESFAYLHDCRRVLRPGGTIVFSFLEFRVPAHWDVMEANLSAIGSDQVLNQFMSTDAVEVWSRHLDLEVIDIFRGDEPFIPLARPISVNGLEFHDFGTFGQSVAVLRKPANAQG